MDRTGSGTGKQAAQNLPPLLPPSIARLAPHLGNAFVQLEALVPTFQLSEHYYNLR